MKLKKAMVALALTGSVFLPGVVDASSYEDGTYRWDFSAVYDEVNGEEYARVYSVCRIDGKDIVGDLVIPSQVSYVVTNELGYTKWDDEQSKDVWVSTRPRQVEQKILNVQWVSGLFVGQATSVTYPPTVEEIWGGYCGTNLTTVVIPDSVKSVQSLFNGSETLTSVVVGPRTSVEGSFRDSAWLKAQGEYVVHNRTLIAYNGNGGAVVVPDGVKKIGSGAFSSSSACTNITSVVLPESVTSIGSWAFEDCENLASVALPSGLVSIDNEAFRYCKKLTTIALPARLKYIGDSAFEDSGISEVNLPDGLRYIGSYAFAFTPLSGVVVPSSVDVCEYAAFEGSTNLVSAVIAGELDWLSESMFEGCSKLASVVLPATIEEIGSWAFAECSALAAIEIPALVEEIEYAAFWGCKNLASVTAGTELDYVENGAFDGTAWMKAHPDGAVVLGGYMFDWKGVVPSTVVIPEGVVYIANWILGYESAIESVVLPSTLQGVGMGTFECCSSLSNVVGGASICYLGNEFDDGDPAFWETPYYDSLAFDKRGSDDAFAFARIGRVLVGYQGKIPSGELSIPSDVTELSMSAFDRDYDGQVATNVVSVVGGESLEVIGPYAFYGCERLASFAVSGPVEDIGYDVFWNADALAHVALPNARLWGIYNCHSGTNLVSLTVGLDEDVFEDEDEFEIWSSEFRGCDKLASVNLLCPGYEIYSCRADTPGRENEAFPLDVTAYKYIGYACDWNSKGEPEDYCGFNLRFRARRVLTPLADSPFNPAMKNVYVGIVYDAEGNFAGTFTVTAAKATAKADGKATVKLVLIGQRPITLKGTIDASGNGQGALAGMKFTTGGVSGSVVANGVGYSVNGAKDAAKEKATEAGALKLAALKGKVWNLALAPIGKDIAPMANGYVGLSVKMGTKGKATIKGTLPTGTKVSVNAQSIVTSDSVCVPFVFSKKESLGFLLWIDDDGDVKEVTGVTNWKSANRLVTFDQKMDFVAGGKIGAPKELVFQMDRDDIPTALSGVLEEFVSETVPFTMNGTRWAFAKNAMVKYTRGAFDVAAYQKGVAAGKTNVSQLKLTQNARQGTFAGSYVIYTVVNGRLKKNKFTVAGVLIDGVGYGVGSLKKIGAMPVVIGTPEEDYEY